MQDEKLDNNQEIETEKSINNLLEIIQDYMDEKEKLVESLKDCQESKKKLEKQLKVCQDSK